MHILGKILAWTVLLAAIAGTILMSRQLQIRNSYTKKLQELKKQNAADALAIAEKEAELARLDADFQREMHTQLAYWDKRSGIPNQGTGTLGIGVGLQDGIGIVAANPQAGNATARRRTRLHVFYQPNPQQPQTVYVGPFNLSEQQGEVAATSSRLYPAWKLRPGQLRIDNPANWPNGVNVYRVRMAAPTRYTTVFRELYLQLDDIARDIVAANAEKKLAENQLTAANAEVTEYRVIIAGNDGTGGMLAELSKAQEERDAVLGVVDRLRRELKIEVDTRNQLVGANKDLVKKLPQPASQSGKQ